MDDVPKLVPPDKENAWIFQSKQIDSINSYVLHVVWVRQKTEKELYLNPNRLVSESGDAFEKRICTLQLEFCKASDTLDVCEYNSQGCNEKHNWI
jgi:hypothetical protein